MRNYIFLLLTFLLLIGCETDLNEPQQPVRVEPTTNEVVYTNGAIYTVNPEQPWAEAVSIKDGVIVAVGDEVTVLESVGEDAQIIDLDGLMMMPGIQDVHLHAIEAGMNENICFFEAMLDPEKYVDEIAFCAEEEQPNSDWVRGAGVNMANLLEYDGFPIDLLDEAVPDRPALILDDLGHGAWANTLAMEAVGYNKLTENPPGGIVDIDPETGRLTGVVLENAQQPLRTASLAPTQANLQLAYEGLLLALETLGQNGITSVSDAGGYWMRGHPEVWQRAVREDTLTVRASNALYVLPNRPFIEQLTDLEHNYTNDPDSLLNFNQAKIYTDGILSQGTGLMGDPYKSEFGLPNVGKQGFPYFDTQLLNEYATELDAIGFQLHFHATGEVGTRLSLNAIEAATNANGNIDKRHRLTHLYLVHPDDRPRFADLNVIADFQLAPSTLDPFYVSDMQKLIGNKADDLLPALELHNEGATVTISSDWDADVLNPFAKMEAILLRETGDAPDLETLIEWMTINPAYLLHQDETTGSIEVGKYADLIVIDRNLFEIQPNNYSRVNVLLTLLAGDTVFRHADAP